MKRILKSSLANYSRSRLRILSFVLAAIIIIAAVPISMFNIFADDGGFTLGLSWQGTSDPTSFTYDSSVPEARLIRLRTSYRNESPSRGYAPGELIIAINGLGDAVRNGTATPAGIAADIAASGTKYYDWSYTYSASTDTYTFTNNFAIPASNTLDGMFEMIWKLNSRETVDDFTTKISAKMRTAYNEQVTADPIWYSQSRVEDEYTVTHSAAKLSSAEGLLGALPAGTTKDDYKWVNYSVSGTDTYNSLDVKDSERFDLWFLQDAIVQSPSCTIVSNGQTKTIDGKVYAGYSVTHNISAYSDNPYLDNIFVAYPKDPYDTAEVVSYVQIMGTYNESDEEVELARHELQIDLTNFGYIDIPGNIYNADKESYGVHSDYVDNHCSSCYFNGAVNSDHLEGGHEYYSTLNLRLNYREREADYYNLEFTDDFLDVELKNGKIRQLTDSEYNFTKVVLSGTSSLKNINGVSLAADTYPAEVYIRRAGASSFETTPYKTTTLKSNSQIITVPDDTVGVRVLIKGVKESIRDNTIVTVYYEFHTNDTNIRTDSGMVYNNMYFNLYNEDGWLNDEYDHNPSVYDTDREYQRDLDTYGHTYDREYDSLHVLEIPNEYRASNSFISTYKDKYSFYFSGNLSSSFSYQADGTVSKFSQYTILPDGIGLTEDVINEETLLAKLNFTADDMTDDYIRHHCTVEIIEDYNGSGRTYIALHYDFSDSPQHITSLAARGIPMYIPQSSVDAIEKTYTMYSATQIEEGSGKWYTRSQDNSSIEGGIWNDIDRDGNTTETTDFSNDSDGVLKVLSSTLMVVKLVSTSTTASFVAPEKNNDTGEYVEGNVIPKEYGGCNYKYDLKLSAGNSKGTHIVFYDILERIGEWKGTYVDVDYRLAARMLGKIPTVYYSSEYEVFDPKTDPEPDLSSGGWTTVKPATVKSIALDFGDAVMDPGEEIDIFITMRAPDNTNGSLDGKLAENNCVSYFTPIDSGTELQLDREYLPSNDVPVCLSPFMGTIRLEKTDEVDNRAVEGAKFDLYAQGSGTPNPATDVRINSDYITNTFGIITTEKLLYGNYYFVETAAAPGYLLPENEADRIFPVTLDSDEPEAYVTVLVTNKRKPGQFTLKKVNDRDETIMVEGAEFAVFDADGTVVQQYLRTDSTGVLTVNGLEWGDYYLLETKAPVGYELYKERVNFTVSQENDAGSALVLIVKDPQKPASAVLVKYEVLEDGHTMTKVPLDGAAYELYYVTASGDKKLGTYMTGDDGKIYADDLTFGSYYFLETIAAQGYTKYEDKIPFTVDGTHTGAECKIITTGDTRIPGSVWLQKRDDSDAIVKGAEYGLYIAATDELVTSADFADSRETTGLFVTNDREGLIEIDGLRWNEYYFKETKAPQGYSLNPEKYPVIVNRQTAYDKVIIQAIDPRGKGSVKLIKVSESDESIRLAGAKFNLYKSNGTLVKEDLVTGEDGILTVTDLEWGNYYFTETEAPENYGLNPNKIRFSVNYLTVGKTQELTVTDPAITKTLEVTKRIATADIVFSHGNPTFTFKLSGTDENGKTRTMYKTVTFSAQYYMAHKNDAFLEQTVIFSDLLAGNYNVCEMNTQRYVLGEIVDISQSGTLSGDGKSVDFNLIGYPSGDATFVNDKINQELTTHTSQLTNVLSRQAKLTSITAIWTGGQVTGETLDRTKLDVYAIYDDGSNVKLADDAYDLDPVTFDSSMNGDYTVSVEYTEGGITVTDSFQVSLNVAVEFTWRVISTEPYEYDGKTYDGQVEIYGYTGKSDVVRFPKEVSGIRTWKSDGNHTFVDDGKTYRVTQLSPNSPGSLNPMHGFSEVKGEGKQIILPDGLLKISMRTFVCYGSYYLWSSGGVKGNVVFPESLTEIGSQAFLGNELSGIEFMNDDMTLGGMAFGRCSSLTGNLDLPDNLTTISYSLFQYCSGLTGDLVIPDGVTSIGDSAFEGCSGFNGELVIPEKVTYIGKSTFNGCSGLTGELVIPDGVTSISENAFNGCSGFTGDLDIPDGVTSININAFRNCTGFNGELVLPENLTSIGSSAFSGCSGFTGNLVIPDKVTSIGTYAFDGCSGFNGNLVIPDSVTSIQYGAFRGCAGLTGNLYIPKNIIKLDDHVFEHCSGFTGNLVIPEKVTSIGDWTFYGCSGFTGNLVIPEKVTSIADYAFYGCSGFTGNLVLPENLTSIGSGAFSGCSGLTGNLVIPDNVTSIELDAFRDCAGFTGNLVIPDNVTSIADHAFSDCTGFTGDLDIPENVTSIGRYAFSGCTGLTGNLVIPDNVTSIGNGVFSNCTGFTGNLVISENVTSIADYAFNGCTGLTGNLVIPDNVTSIGGNAFKDCTGFTGNLVIPDNVTSIGGNAFNGCIGFTGNLVIPESVTTIGNFAFKDMTGLDKILLPVKHQPKTYGCPSTVTVEYY